MDKSQNSAYTIPQDIDARNLRIKIDGVEYEWGGGFGAIIKSWERGIKLGDMRMIGNVPFYCYMFGLKRRGVFGPPEVCWSIPSPYLTTEWIRSFKRALFSVE